MPLTVRDSREHLAREVGYIAASLADIDGSIARAGRTQGVSPSSGSYLSDADLAAMDSARHEAFLDVAILRALESALNNLDEVALRKAGIDESIRDVAERLMKAIKNMKDYVKDVHGVGLGSISVGTIGLGFAATGDDGDDL